MANSANHTKIKFNVGDTVKVHYRIVEKVKKAGKTKKSFTEETKVRIQPYEGTVISIKGTAENKSFIVRKIGADNVGVERTFPISSPWLERVEVLKSTPAKRAKLYHLRKTAHVKTGK
jgi:large subunit ribosomal protein L19